MKKLAIVLLVSLAFTPAGVSLSSAAPYSCSSETRDAEVPSGSQTDENGRTWVGFKDGGLPPDSLSKSSEVSSCTYYPD
jgi:hypothetical protein